MKNYREFSTSTPAQQADFIRKIAADEGCASVRECDWLAGRIQYILRDGLHYAQIRDAIRQVIA